MLRRKFRKTFSVPTKKELDNSKTITYKLKFIGGFRFMSASLSKFVDNLSEIYQKECKASEERRNINSECNFIELENNKLNCKCKEFNKKSSKSINESIEKFPNMDQFCNGDINKIVLLLRKIIYLYEHMDSWERFNETSILDEKAFYSELYSEDITDEGYTHYKTSV